MNFLFYFLVDSIITTTKIEQSLKIIDNLETNFLSEETLNKIERAISFLNESQNINKEIFLFSDFQKSTFVTGNSLDSIDLITKQNDIKFYSFDMSLENTKNISINNLQLKNSIIEINKPLAFSATINNHSEESINNITASLFLNNKRVAQQNVSLNQREKKNIEFETSLSSTGLIEVRIELEEDNIVEDNMFYLNFWVPEKIKTLLLYENNSDLVFLESALNSYSKSDQIEVTKLQIGNSSNENLEKYNLIFLISGEIGNAQKLSDYLNNGGNLVFIPSNNITIFKLSNIKSIINLPSFKDIVISSLEMII